MRHTLPRHLICRSFVRRRRRAHASSSGSLLVARYIHAAKGEERKSGIPRKQGRAGSFQIEFEPFSLPEVGRLFDGDMS